jgi:hypothetical protein
VPVPVGEVGILKRSARAGMAIRQKIIAIAPQMTAKLKLRNVDAVDFFMTTTP